MSEDLIKRKYAMYALCNGCEKFKQCNTDNDNWCDKGWVIRRGIPSEGRPSVESKTEKVLNEIYDAVNGINALIYEANRPSGEWILECDAEGEDDNLYRCSECGCNYSCQEYDIPNFCPNCGADMRERKESE